MSAKKFYLILGGVAAVSFAGSVGVSIFAGGKKLPAKSASGATSQPSPSEAYLARLTAAGSAADRVPPDQARLEDLAKELRARMEEYERKSTRLEEREKRVVQAEQELQRRAKELETLRMELVGPLTRLKDAMAELDRKSVQVDKDEKVNLQRIAATFEKMDAVRGSGILAGMCANNQVEDVVKILAYMSERGAGKVLAEMTDQAMAAKLTALWKKVKEQG